MPHLRYLLVSIPSCVLDKQPVLYCRARCGSANGLVVTTIDYLDRGTLPSNETHSAMVEMLGYKYERLDTNDCCHACYCSPMVSFRCCKYFNIRKLSSLNQLFN